MAVGLPKTYPTTGNKNKIVLGGTTVSLPQTGGGSNKNNTGGTYTNFFGTGGGTSTNPTTPIALQGSTPTLTGGVGTGVSANNGGTYTNYLSTVVTPPSGTVNGYTEVKPVNNTQYFDGGAVGTTDGGFSGGNNNGITDEGLIVGAPKNADDATFDNNGFKGNGELFTNPTSGTYTDIIKTSAPVGGNDKKEEEKVETGGGTGGGDTGGTGSTGEIPMTYQEYYAEAMKNIEADKAAAVKRAEVAEERAMADAQASYMQNMATYGANAEQMAQMGLTGGGYSDYLNAQAYAQKREDAQVATANKNSAIEAAESTYADNVLGLKKEMADITYAEGLKKEQEEKDKQDKLDTNYSSILIKVQENPDAYNETGLRAWCKNNGFDETQTQSVVDTWKEATRLADEAFNTDSSSGEQGQIVMSDVIKAIQDGTLTKADGTAYSSWEEIYETLLRARNDGQNITQEDINNAKKAYNEWIAYRDGRITTDDYYDALNGDEEATAKVDREMNTERLQQNAKDKVEEMLAGDGLKIFGSMYKSKSCQAVDTVAADYKAKNFGDFNDISDADSKQGKYVQAIVNDAKAGKIAVGSLVGINYGEVWDDSGVYIYMGDGIFVNAPWNSDVNTVKNKIKNYYELDLPVYIPDGYKIQKKSGKIYKK